MARRDNDIDLKRAAAMLADYQRQENEKFNRRTATKPLVEPYEIYELYNKLLRSTRKIRRRVARESG